MLGVITPPKSSSNPLSDTVIHAKAQPPTQPARIAASPARNSGAG
jgi:hypothetical protein